MSAKDEQRADLPKHVQCMPLLRQERCLILALDILLREEWVVCLCKPEDGHKASCAWAELMRFAGLL